jgi:hypothetical protein
MSPLAQLAETPLPDPMEAPFVRAMFAYSEGLRRRNGGGGGSAGGSGSSSPTTTGAMAATLPWASPTELRVSILSTK